VKPQTLNYYNQNSQSFCQDTFDLDMSDLRNRFLAYLPHGGTILDAGCGSGRDSLFFHQAGYRVTSMDASEAMAHEAQKLTGLPVECRGFEDVSEENTYDGIWACASLLHVLEYDQPKILARLLKALKPTGVLYVSYKYGDSERIKDGRHFTDANEQRLQSWLNGLLEFSHLITWQTEDVRPSHTVHWLNGIVIRELKPIVGKKVLSAIYWHVLRNPEQPDYIRNKIIYYSDKLGLAGDSDFNVVKYSTKGDRISLLHYPGFFTQAFPELLSSITIDCTNGSSKRRLYQGHANTPILHRKELLLPKNHTDVAVFKGLTESAESLGLFADSKQIGFKHYWLTLVKNSGYEIVGHELLPIGNSNSPVEPLADSSLIVDGGVARFRTAISRSNLSAPVQALARYGFLDGSHTVFDYGCGKGDDVRNLGLNNIPASGWDPHFAPMEAKVAADLVNLGFVLNVIENPEERKEALVSAYTLANKLLAVSVMLYNQNAFQGTDYSDGILTSRQTFQKYFTQIELKHYIDSTLGVDSVPVGPGIFFVFKDEDAEQLFLQARYRSRAISGFRVSKPERAVKEPRESIKVARFTERMLLLQPLMEQWLDLGREPEALECQQTAELLSEFGSFRRAINFLRPHLDFQQLEQSKLRRSADVLTYLALQFFSKRKAYSNLALSIQRDIKAFFGSYANAKLEAEDILFQIGDSEEIQAACVTAASQNCGYLDEEGALTIASVHLTELPALLRVYVGCAALLYGDTESADLIKIHARTGKLSLMRYDDFTGLPLPKLLERVKINLRSQKFDYFQYGDEYESTYLYFKSRYLLPSFPDYEEQLGFDEALRELRLFEFRGYGPKPKFFDERLLNNRVAIQGFRIVGSEQIPSLDSPCGRHLKYRDLIECGETWLRTKLDNSPLLAGSYNALFQLASKILDPVIDYFGMICLTYGFSSAKLSKFIPGRIAPKLDQHACLEVNRLGNLICERKGAACDFYIEDEDMLEVAQWIVANLPFDRLYFYGSDRPIHVSYGPEHNRQIVVMKLRRERVVPQLIDQERFIDCLQAVRLGNCRN